MTKHIKQINTNKQNYSQPLNYDIKKAIEPKGIQPKEVFDNYVKDDKKNSKANKKKKSKKKPKGRVPKGSHRMADGSIMKDSDMKKKKKY
tara:strand:+ start:2265 stop:2534 length:270 start_codon:yes stop_codon:yes gene_type:complete